MFLKPRRRSRRGVGFTNNDSWEASQESERTAADCRGFQLYQPDDSWAASSISVQAAHLVTQNLTPLIFLWGAGLESPRAWEQHST